AFDGGARNNTSNGGRIRRGDHDATTGCLGVKMRRGRGAAEQRSQRGSPAQTFLPHDRPSSLKPGPRCRIRCLERHQRRRSPAHLSFPSSTQFARRKQQTGEGNELGNAPTGLYAAQAAHFRVTRGVEIMKRRWLFILGAALLVVLVLTGMTEAWWV